MKKDKYEELILSGYPYNDNSLISYDLNRAIHLVLLGTGEYEWFDTITASKLNEWCERC